MVCDLCSKKGPTTKTRIEGVVYDACKDCASLGEDATPAQPAKKRSSSRTTYSEELFVRSDAGTVIRKARESRGLSHKDFAKKLNVKESSLHAWETNNRQPTVDTAKRIQKQLSVRLLEKSSGQSTSQYTPSAGSSSSSSMTIADMIKDKLPKK